jgi:hypothetical protein
MPKFKVHFTRMVEEIATVEIEAETLEDALDEATEIAHSDWAELDTEPGDWCDDPEAYAAHDEKGELVFDWNDEQHVNGSATTATTEGQSNMTDAEQLADAILALINSQPSTPSREQLVEVIRAQLAREADYTGADVTLTRGIERMDALARMLKEIKEHLAVEARQDARALEERLTRIECAVANLMLGNVVLRRTLSPEALIERYERNKLASELATKRDDPEL